jgi:hypothetical protein
LELNQEAAHQGQELSGQIRDLSAAYRRDVRKMVGEENLEKYTEFRHQLRSRVRQAVMRAPPGVVGETEIREARLEAAEKSRAFLKELGFDMACASKVRSEYERRLQETVARALGRSEEPNYLVLPEDVPEEVHNPWALYQPPNPGWAWDCSWARWDEPYNPSFCRHLHPVSGELGSYIHTHVSGADDSDFAYVRYRTAMPFWHWMPAAGLVEVWMQMQSISTPYAGYLRDEWGWSNGDGCQLGEGCDPSGSLSLGPSLLHRQLSGEWLGLARSGQPGLELFLEQ